MDAEMQCVRDGAHLVSIRSQDEMNFIHDLLVKNYVFNEEIYIGEALTFSM